MAFLALPLDPRVSQSILAGLDPLRSTCPEIKWQQTADYHITLRFLGACPEDKLAQIIESLRLIAPSAPMHQLQVGELSFFPERHGRAIIWVGIKKMPPPLMKLAHDLEAWARGMGFTPEFRPFVPHITVGRCSTLEYTAIKSQLSAFQCPHPDIWDVTKYALMILSPDGHSTHGEPIYQQRISIILDDPSPNSEAFGLSQEKT
jgi:2'-5' RNA ligase